MNDAANQIEPGQIFCSSWGYDQTNVDFYRVVQLKGDWITLEPIAAQQSWDPSGSMTGQAIPAEPIKATGKAFRRKLLRFASGASARIASYSFAYPWDGHPMRTSCYA